MLLFTDDDENGKLNSNNLNSFSSCQLFTDQDQLHRNNAIQAANTTKINLGVNKTPKILKFDLSTNTNM